MGTKRAQGGRQRPEDDSPPALGALIAEICETPKAAPAPATPRAGRSRRAGPFKVPASLVGPGNRDRDEIARRFKQHLRGVSGANKLGPDPDEYVPPARQSPQRAARPGMGFRPGMPPRFGRPTPSVIDDDED